MRLTHIIVFDRAVSQGACGIEIGSSEGRPRANLLFHELAEGAMTHELPQLALDVTAIAYRLGLDLEPGGCVSASRLLAKPAGVFRRCSF